MVAKAAVVEVVAAAEKDGIPSAFRENESNLDDPDAAWSLSENALKSAIASNDLVAASVAELVSALLMNTMAVAAAVEVVAEVLDLRKEIASLWKKSTVPRPDVHRQDTMRRRRSLSPHLSEVLWSRSIEAVDSPSTRREATLRHPGADLPGLA